MCRWGWGAEHQAGDGPGLTVLPACPPSPCPNGALLLSVSDQRIASIAINGSGDWVAFGCSGVPSCAVARGQEQSCCSRTADVAPSPPNRGAAPAPGRSPFHAPVRASTLGGPGALVGGSWGAP